MDFPVWLEIILAISLSIGLAGLGAWVLATWAIKAINKASRFDTKRCKKNEDAIIEWQRLYEDERKARLADNAALLEEIGELNEEIGKLDKEIKELKNRIKAKDELLAKRKVKDL